MIHVGVDPGLSGAIVSLGNDGLIFAAKMPETPREIWDTLGEAIGDGPFRLCLEKVGAAVRRDKHGQAIKQGVASSWKFAQNFGQLQSSCCILELSCPGSHYFEAAPVKWQGYMGLLFTPEERAGKDGDVLYREKKRRNREIAKAMFPAWRVVGWCADAFLLAEYSRRLYEDEL